MFKSFRGFFSSINPLGGGIGTGRMLLDCDRVV